MSANVDAASSTDNERTDAGLASEYNQIKNVIAVMSGKGGVGKSLVTGLLASALAKFGYQTGILDADITGPSIPMLFGMRGPVTAGEYGIQPLHSRTGIKVMSMNLLLEHVDQPVIWRGPLISKAIKELCGDVMWGRLDYLLVDLPPGTSDAALTIMQSLPLRGIIMVTTPQGLATLIVNKAVRMAQAVGVPIIGVVENMAYFICPDTNKRYAVFGPSHTEKIVNAANAPVIAQIPIDPHVAELCDAGKVEDVELKQIPGMLDSFLRTIQRFPSETPDRVKSSADKQSDAELSKEKTGSQKVPQPSSSDSRRTNTSIFSEKARRLIENRTNLGWLEKPDARGEMRGECGDHMQIDLGLDGEVIKEALFITDGCGATVACGSMVTSMAKGKTLIEAQQITPGSILAALDGLPKAHEHCAVLAVDTLLEAVVKGMEKLSRRGRGN